MKRELIGKYNGCLSEDIDDYLISLYPSRAEIVVFMLYTEGNKQRNFYLSRKRENTEGLDAVLEGIEMQCFNS